MVSFYLSRERKYHIINDVFQLIPFCIVGSDDEKIEVINPLRGELVTLTTVSHTYEEFNVCRHCWRTPPYIRPLGIERTEAMLREGAILTVIGDLELTFHGMIVQAPSGDKCFVVSTYPMPTIIEHFQARGELFKYSMIFTGAVGLCILVMIYVKWKDQRR